MARVSLQERLDPPALARCRVDREDRLAVAAATREGGVEKAHMVERDDGVGARLVRGFRGPSPRAGRSARKIDRQQVAERAASAWCGRSRWRRAELSDAQHDENAGGCRSPVSFSAAAATATVPPAMNAALSTLTAATTRARRSGAGPGLDCREGRHDEQAAGDREAGESDRDMRRPRPVVNSEKCRSGPGRPLPAAGRPAEVERRTGRSARRR